MKKGLWLFYFLFFFRISNSPAQILNIDKTDTSEYRSTPSFNLNLSSGVEIDKQKITVYDASNSLDASLQKSRCLYIFSSSYRFTYNGPDDILNAGYFHLRFRYDYKNTLHPESFVQFQWDNKRGIVYRKLAGINIRWNNYLHPKVNLILAMGMMAELEEWNYNGVEQNNYLEPLPDVKTTYIKSTDYIKLEIKTSDHSDLFVTTFVQFRPDRFYNHIRVANVIKWNIGASKHFGVEFNFSSVYDTHPVVPISHYYFSLSNSLVYKI